jgi:hypothetical protein
MTRIMGNSRAWLGSLCSRPIPALVASMLAIAGVATLSRLWLTEARANAFVDMAAQTHREELAGQIPLEVRTNSPSEISAWFADKVPFRFRLPTYQDVSGEGQQYELTGGRLVDFKGAPAAYISYRMPAQIISLVLTSASSSVAAGGEKTVSKANIPCTSKRRIAGSDLVGSQSYLCLGVSREPADQPVLRCVPRERKRQEFDSTSRAETSPIQITILMLPTVIRTPQ